MSLFLAGLEDVRLPCPDVDLSSFHPAQGDLVEYEMATESQAAWAVAQVASHSACLWRLQWLDRPGEVLMPLAVHLKHLMQL